MMDIINGFGLIHNAGSGLYSANHHIEFAKLHSRLGNTWFPATRLGSTASGHTYETMVLGKKEDNLAEADAFSTEVKTTLSKAKGGRVRLFTHTFGVEGDLLFQYGRPTKCGTSVRFARQLRVHKPVKWGDETALLLPDNDFLVIEAGLTTGIIPKSAIDTVLEKKLTNLCIVQGMKKIEEEVINFRYPQFTYYGGIKKDVFYDLLFNQQKIAVEFRIKDGKDNGTSFNISKSDLPKLYDFHYTYEV